MLTLQRCRDSTGTENHVTTTYQVRHSGELTLGDSNRLLTNATLSRQTTPYSFWTAVTISYAQLRSHSDSEQLTNLSRSTAAAIAAASGYPCAAL
jgi:hypothetical protein